MSLRAKFAIGIAVCSLLIMGIVSGVWFNLDRESALVGLLNADAFGHVEEMETRISDTRADMYGYAATRDPALLKRAHDQLAMFDDLMVLYRGTAAYRTAAGDIEKNLSQRSIDAKERLVQATNQLAQESSQSVPSVSQLRAYETAVAGSQSAAKELAHHERSEAADKQATLVSDVERSKFLLILTAIGALTLGVIMQLLTTSWVTRPVRRLTAAIERVSAGELDEPYVGGKKDEIGDLARAFDEMRVRLKAAMDGLGGEIDERRSAEAKLAETNIQLEETVHQLEVGADADALISEMGSSLQSAIDPEESYSIIAKYSSRIMPGTSGRLMMLDPDNETARTVATWGTRPGGQATFGHDKCWALRSNQQHTYLDPSTDMRCAHLRKGEGPSICVPLAARGETMGLLTVVCAPDGGCLSAQEQGLPQRIVELGALAIADLRLRISLKEQSIRDSLTGLFNRRFMEEWLERALAQARRVDGKVAVLFVDLDDFKGINDTFGHAQGDAMLIEVARRLVSALRQSDTVGRFGGDEFTVVMSGVKDCEQLEVAGQRVLEAVAAPYRIGDDDMQITASVGVAVFTADATDAPGLMQQADQAMYSAKAMGRNRVQFYSEDSKQSFDRT